MISFSICVNCFILSVVFTFYCLFSPIVSLSFQSWFIKYFPASPVTQKVKILLPHRRLGLDPWVRNITGRRARNPIPVFLPGKFHGQGAWWATVYGVAQSRTLLMQLSSSSSSPKGSRRRGRPWSPFVWPRACRARFPVVMYGCES